MNKHSCKTIDWMQTLIDRIDPNRFLDGPLTNLADLARLEHRIEDHNIKVWWGWGGPSLSESGIAMPCHRLECSIRMAGALAHEYGHVRQKAEGRLNTRWDGNVSSTILMEELDASVIGTRALLDLDMWHPQHGFVLALAWFGYLAGWVQSWAYGRQKAQRARAAVEVIVAAKDSEAVLKAIRREAIS